MSLARLLLQAILVVVIAAAVGLAAYFFSDQQPKRYEARTQIRLGVTGPALTAIGFGAGSRSNDDAERDAANQVLELGSYDIAKQVARRGGRLSADKVASDVSITNERGSDVLTIIAEGSSRSAASMLARRYRDTVIERQRASVVADAKGARAALEKALAKLTPAARRGPTGSQLRNQIAATELLTGESNSVVVVQGVRASDDPVSPQTTRNTLFGVALGLLLGVGLVALLGATRPPRRQAPAPPLD